MKKTFTKEDMLANRCCYSEKQLMDCSFMKSDVITIESIVDSEIPLKHKFWFVIKKCELERRAIGNIAIDCAESVLHIYETKYPDNKAPREAIQATRDYRDGSITLDELKSKRSAASASASASAAAYAAADAAAAAKEKLLQILKNAIK